MHRFDQPAWARLASSFHRQVAALARNPVLEGYLAELLSRCALVVSLYEPPGNASCEHDEHEHIVDCLERRDAAGVPNAPTQNLQEVFDHEQTRAVEMVRRLGDQLSLLAIPLRLDGQRPPLRSPAPALGADTAAVLGEEDSP